MNEQKVETEDDNIESLAEAWFLGRLSTDTASVQGAKIGWCPYKDPNWCWLESRGHMVTKNEDKPCMRWGRDTEGDAINSLESTTTGLKCKPAPFRRNSIYPRLGSTPDGLIEKDIDGLFGDQDIPALVECKALSSEMPNAPPLMYVAQMYAQMRDYRIPKIYFVCWSLHEVRIWELYWCNNFYAYMEPLIHVFFSCVKYDVPPANMIPFVGHAAQKWSSQYAYTNRHLIVKEFGIQDWQLPPTPPFRLRNIMQSTILKHDRRMDEILKVGYIPRVSEKWFKQVFLDKK